MISFKIIINPLSIIHKMLAECKRASQFPTQFRILIRLDWLNWMANMNEKNFAAESKVVHKVVKQKEWNEFYSCHECKWPGIKKGENGKYFSVTQKLNWIELNSFFKRASLNAVKFCSWKSSCRLHNYIRSRWDSMLFRYRFKWLRCNLCVWCVKWWEWRHF